MGLSCKNVNAAATERCGEVEKIGFPEYVEPVIINGKTFERADLPETVNTVTALLCSAQMRPANQKISAARFLLATDESGVVRLKPSIKKYCTDLLK